MNISTPPPQNHSWRLLKQGKTLALHRRCRPQVLSAAALPLPRVVSIFAGTSFSSSSSPGSSARCFHLRWLLGTEHSDEAVLFKIDDAVIKAEADRLQQVQDHDLKGSLFCIYL